MQLNINADKHPISRIQNPPPKGVPVRVWPGAPSIKGQGFQRWKPFSFFRLKIFRGALLANAHRKKARLKRAF
jgi:hypothetical protein